MALASNIIDFYFIIVVMLILCYRSKNNRGMLGIRVGIYRDMTVLNLKACHAVTRAKSLCWPISMKIGGSAGHNH